MKEVGANFTRAHSGISFWKIDTIHSSRLWLFLTKEINHVWKGNTPSLIKSLSVTIRGAAEKLREVRRSPYNRITDPRAWAKKYFIVFTSRRP